MPRRISPDSKSTKEQRCACCGQKIVELIDGKIRKVTWKCRDWKICPNCFVEHMNMWKDSVISSVVNLGREVYYDVTSWEYEDDVRKKLHRINDRGCSYIIFRAEDSIYLFHNDDSESQNKISIIDVADLDWRKITRTKAGRRISSIGSFKPQMPKTNKDGMIKIKVRAINTNAPSKQQLELWKMARLNCGNPMPKTHEEEEEVLKVVTKEYIKLLQNNGYNAGLFLLTRYIPERNKVEWEPIENLRETPEFSKKRQVSYV